ncbi:MAG: helix-turn-helix domain-containing protein [Bdellovibrionaceae bacterium]|nr:helix-turn-helix domain-containing protein [Pseudobdellovibrionaceae bacterium]
MTLISISELSDALKIPKNTLYQLVHRRAIPHYKIGKALRFDVCEVLTHLQRGASPKDTHRLLTTSEPSSLKIESAMRARRDLHKGGSNGNYKK